MKCPIDDSELVMSERHGIEIDYCPKCRGVWLDRGELDKIIDRAAPAPQPESHAPGPSYAEPPRDERGYRPERDSRDYRDSREYRQDDDHYRRKPYKKRESFLGEIFDF